MSNLDIAKSKLNEVGAALSKSYKSGETSQDRIMPLLKTLKKVNDSLTKIIAGEDDEEFSFDSLNESVEKPNTAKKLSESQMENFGVDLGSFNDLMTPASEKEGFDWKQTFKEANDSKGGGVSVDMDKVAESDFDASVYGRMVDNT